MVKLKARYYLVEIIPGHTAKFEATSSQIFKELMKLIGDMHGDAGFAAVKASITVKLTDGDICLIKIETSVEKYLSSVLPFLISITGSPVVMKTIFIGRSIRACEKTLLKLRRRELYCAFGTAETGVEKNTVLEAINSVSENLE